MDQTYKIWRPPESRFGIHCEFPDDPADETINAGKHYPAEEPAKTAECKSLYADPLV